MDSESKGELLGVPALAIQDKSVSKTLRDIVNKMALDNMLAYNRALSDVIKHHGLIGEMSVEKSDTVFPRFKVVQEYVDDGNYPRSHVSKLYYDYKGETILLAVIRFKVEMEENGDKGYTYMFNYEIDMEPTIFLGNLVTKE